jgi:hypothetical protein
MNVCIVGSLQRRSLSSDTFNVTTLVFGPNASVITPLQLMIDVSIKANVRKRKILCLNFM